MNSSHVHGVFPFLMWFICWDLFKDSLGKGKCTSNCKEMYIFVKKSFILNFESFYSYCAVSKTHFSQLYSMKTIRTKIPFIIIPFLDIIIMLVYLG